MGRWAQRSRSGGASPILLAMMSGRRVDSFNWRITYTGPVSASSLSNAAFDSLPNNVTVGAITQIGTREVNISWDDTAGSETSIRYQGTTPGITTPQTLVVP